jgi:hypothetical protein
MSWLWRGFQSAVFYYLSCAPCTKIAYQRRRHKATQRAKAERAATETEQGLYRHPSPFSTNIYWREEMALGPGPPQRRSNRDRERAKTESSRGLRSGGVGSSSVTGTSSADTVVEMEHGEPKGHGRTDEDGWNHRRYQREDENLWGVSCDSVTSMSQSSATGGCMGYYHVARNPAVNDLHPPVVSTHPTNPSQTRWMLQPPPSAKIMEGKKKSPRRRSGSGTSNISDSSRKRDDRSLGRKIGERLMEEKVRRGEGPGMFNLRSVSSMSDAMPRLPSCESGQSEAQPQGQPHDRNACRWDTERRAGSLSTGLDDFSPRRTSHPPPPPLSTIRSSSTVPHDPHIDSKSCSSSSRPLEFVTLPHPARTPDLPLSLRLNSTSPSNRKIPHSRRTPREQWQEVIELSSHHQDENQTFGTPVHDQWWSNDRGEMDWRFSLDMRQKQLTEHESERRRIARWSMDIWIFLFFFLQEIASCLAVLLPEFHCVGKKNWSWISKIVSFPPNPQIWFFFLFFFCQPVSWFVVFLYLVPFPFFCLLDPSVSVCYHDDNAAKKFLSWSFFGCYIFIKCITTNLECYDIVIFT